jgi:hypothetical protein
MTPVNSIGRFISALLRLSPPESHATTIIVGLCNRKVKVDGLAEAGRVFSLFPDFPLDKPLCFTDNY